MYDASLDAFKIHNWTLPRIQRINRSRVSWTTGNAFNTVGSRLYQKNWNQYVSGNYQKSYDQLNWFGFSMYGFERYQLLDAVSVRSGGRNKMSKAGETMAEQAPPQIGVMKEEDLDSAEPVTGNDGTTPPTPDEELSPIDTDGIQIRKNLQETAFFYPHLKTDGKGNIVFSFTTPEALTKWKFQAMSHTQGLGYGFNQRKK